MSNEASTPVATHGVLYTDGGCDNPTTAGWGLHGYLFTMDPAKQGTGNPKAVPTEDGYEMGKSGVPTITLTQYVDAFGSIIDMATNNVAETEAARQALQVAKDQNLKHLTLVMDSQYAMNGLDTWMYDWNKSGWTKRDGSPVANANLWKQVYALKTELTDAGVTFSCKWVKGHSGNLGNERADSLATAGKMAARNRTPRESVKLTPAKGFWSKKNERNRMFSLPNWYFAAFGERHPTAPGERHVYYTGTIRESVDLIGKAISDASFAILFLKERDPVLDIVQDGTQDMYTGRPQGVMVGYLPTIFKPETYDELADYGRDLLIKSRRNRHLMTKDKKMVLHEADPPGLSFRLIDHLGFLEDRLRQYLMGKESNLRTTDITDLLYEITEAKGKTSVKLKNTITTGTRSLNIEGVYRSDSGEDRTASFALTLAQDLPDRNTLSAMAVEGVKVQLLTWPESSHAIRFAIVIEVNGDVGIWAGPYSNLLVLPFPTT